MSENLVATTQALPDPPPLTGVGHFNEQASWALYVVGAVLAGFLWFRRKASRVSTEINNDRAEVNIVGTLTKERDKAMADAREAWTRRTQDAEQIARLSSENEYLKRDVATLTQRVGELQQSLDAVMTALSTLKPDFKLARSGTTTP